MILFKVWDVLPKKQKNNVGKTKGVKCFPLSFISFMLKELVMERSLELHVFWLLCLEKKYVCSLSICLMHEQLALYMNLTSKKKLSLNSILFMDCSLLMTLTCICHYLFCLLNYFRFEHWFLWFTTLSVNISQSGFIFENHLKTKNCRKFLPLCLPMVKSTDH